MLIEGVKESNNRRKTIESMGYSGYSDFFDGREIPHQFDRDELLGSEFAQDFLSHAQDRVGDYKYVKKGLQERSEEAGELQDIRVFRRGPGCF